MRERRSERLTLAVTPEEMQAVETVARARGVRPGRRGEGYASMLRTMSLREIVREARRLRQIIGDAGRAMSRAA